MEERSRQPRRQRVAETSSGGFVLAADGSNTVALIGRQTRSRRIDWCVPKGHPEGNETLEQAAIREVFEETGIHAEIILKLGSIDYEFTAGRKVIAKTVHQFLMRQTGGNLTVENDPNHEAVEARWVSVDDLNTMLSHENERRMARAVLEWVERSRA
jgi:8-oxo-dGTP pyrophosphatase MutT (NUDIX family)